MGAAVSHRGACCAPEHRGRAGCRGWPHWKVAFARSPKASTAGSIGCASKGGERGVIVGVDRRVASPRSRGWASHTVMAVGVQGRVADEAFLSRGRRDFETVSMAPGFLDCRVIGAGAKFAMNAAPPPTAATTLIPREKPKKSAPSGNVPWTPGESPCSRSPGGESRRSLRAPLSSPYEPVGYRLRPGLNSRINGPKLRF